MKLSKCEVANRKVTSYTDRTNKEARILFMLS